MYAFSHYLQRFVSLLSLYIGAAGYSLFDAEYDEPTGSFFSSVKKKAKTNMESIRAAETRAGSISSEDVVLVAVAHPDDETVLHGEVIKRSIEAGAEVHIAFATAGEQSTVNNRFWQPNFVKNKHRWQEALRAGKRLGVKSENLHNLDLPDGRVEQNLDLLTEKLGYLLVAKNVTKVVTSGPLGYDKHLDHIAVDSAALRAVQQQSKHAQVWQLDVNGNGEVAFKVDSRSKLRATIAHFSQFMGLSFLGRVLLPARTKRYLAHYHDLVYKEETYNIQTGKLTSSDAYRDAQSMYNDHNGDAS